jgi:hypothetical protein
MDARMVGDRGVPGLPGHQRAGLAVSRSAVGRLAAYGLVVVVFAGGLWFTDYRFDQSLDAIEDERLVVAERACDDAAETRRVLRQMVREGGIASGIAGGEALILAVGDADPEVVDLYRAHLVDQLTPALERIVNELPDREWDAEAGECVDVPVAE